MATLYKNKGISESEKGQPGGVATLDENGKIPADQIPGGLGQGDVDSVNGVLPDVNGNVSLTTSNMPEGTNLYWTQARFNTAYTNASSSLELGLQTLQTNLANEITNRTNGDNALDTRVTALEGQVSTLEGQVSTLEGQVSGFDTRLTSAETDIDSLQTDLSNKASSQSVTDLATRVTTAESDIDSLQTDLSNKASSQSVTDLATRVTTAEADIDTLQADILTLTAGVDLRALEADLQSEITNRTNADNALDTRLDDVEAHHLHSNSYYVNDGLNDFQAVIDDIGADQGNVIYASAGSYGGATLSIQNKVNLGIICPNAGNTICELAGGRGLSISGTSERVRITNLQIEGATSITGTKGRHIFQSVQFLGGLTIDSVTDSSATFMTFTDCEFANQNILISNITNCTIYFNRCSFSNLRIIPSNVASPFLIIVSECSGLNTLQTNLTSGVAIVGRTGYANNTVKTFTTSANFISALGVETSFTGSYTELRDKPTLVTASTQLSDSAQLLRISDKGVANGVAELDANGYIPNHHIPPLALTKPYVVQTIAERDALTGINTGDVAIVVNDPTSSNNGNYIYDSDGPSWIKLYNSSSPVNQVNGQIGDVTLYTGDISEGVGAQGEESKLYFTDSRALSAAVTNNIDDATKAPGAPTVKLYVTGITDALDSRVDTLETSALTFATVAYVDSGLAGKLDSTSYTANDVLTKIKTVAGSGSGLDADLLDGLDSSAFVRMTTDQTIAGTKTFSASPILPDLSANDNSTKGVNSKYVDSAIANVQSTIGANGALIYQGTYNASTAVPSLANAKKGFFYQVSTSGTLAGVTLTANDQIVFISDVSGGVVQATDFIVIDNTESLLSNGNMGIIALTADNSTMTSGFYHLMNSSGNWNIRIPSFVNTKIGDVIYLRIRGTGTFAIIRTATNYTATFYYNNTTSSNGLASLRSSGEYIFRCTAKDTTTSTVSWEVTNTNDRAIRTTDDLTEGSTNKYASATNVRSLLSATAPIVFTSATGVISTTLTQYTDALARSAAGAGLASGNATNTGITFTNNTGASRIDAVVSLAGFSVNALSDVDTATTAPTNGQALVWESASSLWKPGTVSGGGGGGGDITFGTVVSANNTVLTLSTSNTMYLVDNTTNAWTVYLPAISSVTGRRLLIKRMGTGLVTIARNASDSSVNIDYAGQTSIDMGAQYATFELVANASNNMWYLI